MLQKAKIIVTAALLSVQPAMAVNKRDQVNFRSHILQHGFHPQDYDISNITAIDRDALHMQRQQLRQRKAEERKGATRVTADIANAKKAPSR